MVTACTFVARMDVAVDVYDDLEAESYGMAEEYELYIKLINMNSKYGLLDNYWEIFDFVKNEVPDNMSQC